MKGRFKLVLFVLYTNFLFAQSNFFDKPVFSVSLVNHSIGIPFKEIMKTPLNLGISFAVDFPYNQNQFQKVEVGWYKHKNLASAIWIKTDYVRRFQDNKGLFADVRGGIGYIRDFIALDSYKLNSEGKYQLRKGHGKGGLIGGFGMASGYSFEFEESSLISPFIDYQGFIQFPYTKISPVLPHSLLSIGSRLQKL